MDHVSYLVVFVSGMQGSIQFYRDALGLPVKFESPGWTEFATQGTTLALHAARPEDGRAAYEYKAAGHCHPGFSVADIAAFHGRLTERGVRCLQEPAAQDFGTLAVYADPDGLPVTLFQERPR